MYENKEQQRVLIDARQVSQGSEFRCDVCVIGSGPAGIAIADRLRNSHLSVILLEAGGVNYSPTSQRLYRGRNVGHPYYRIDSCRWRMFGGSSNRWGGWCRPLDPVDYTRRDWLPLSGWPISAEDVAPYEEDAARLCELANARFDLASWRHRLAPPLVLDDTNFENVVIQYSPETNFAESYGPRLISAPNVTTLLHANVTQLRLDSASGRLRELEVSTLTARTFVIRPRAVVLASGGIENPRLLLASRSERAGGVGNEFDMVGRCFMEHLHMPTGHFFPAKTDVNTTFYHKAVMQDARVRGVIIPTASAQDRHRLLATSIAFEGPSFSLGTAFLGWPPVVMAGPVRLYEGLRKKSYTRAAHEFKGVATRLFTVPSRVRSWQRSRRAASQAGRSAAPGSVYSLYFLAEQAPDPSNRVLLDSNERDALGVPRSRLEWSIKPADSASAMGWLELLKSDLQARGVGEVMTLADGWQDKVVGGPHHMGTTRMSADPRRGVVDADCRVHSVENLYVAGSSVFATSGYANPTFTIVCLALRLADTLRKRLSGP
jgi:choline dehydrogenase-like flavoprotein